jgi:D-beta-D-heptose 7-phosphate kinase / D-beta-D-heptose 1-phosphate adenosyltransferase
LNSDASVRLLKGAGRPVNEAGDRAAVLIALRAVDAGVIFDEVTPERLIETIRPDVYVKGGDYRMLPERRLVESLGGRTVILDLVDGRSTTRIIERLNEVGTAGFTCRAGPPTSG